MRRFVAPLLALVLLFSACGGDSTGPDSKTDLTGTWAGSISDGTLSLTVNHNTSTNTLTGSGNIVGPGGSAALVIQGNFAKPNVSMTLSPAGYAPLNVTAQISGNTMTGTANGSGMSNVSVNLARN